MSETNNIKAPKDGTWIPLSPTGGTAPALNAPKKGFPWRIALGVLLGLFALAAALYQPFSQWWNDKEHAKAIAGLNEVVAVGPEERLAQIRQDAIEYNKKFLASGDNSDYLNQLDPTSTGMIGRIKIPAINIDIPIYHTSSDSVLKKGAGHMEETTLPVGGPSTHAAITAHRGLAESKLFTDLDKVKIGDTFTLEILGEPLVYEVKTTRIVEPTETQWLTVEPNRDLVTLITCDPLGINTERMLVTGERIYPTPPAAYEDAAKDSDLPGFPTWALWLTAGLVFLGGMVWYTIRPTKKKEVDYEILEPDPAAPQV